MAMEVENQATSPALDDFLASGRTGRRNAIHPMVYGMPDNSMVSTASLPDKLQKLTCEDMGEISIEVPSRDGASGSGQNAQGGAAKT